MNKMKPLPIIDNDSIDFWEGCKEGKLLIQQCNSCKEHIYYPRIVCPNCMSTKINYVESSGEGSIYSYTIAHRGAGPSYKDDIPYVVALIDLDEGVRMLSNIVGCEPEDVHIEMRVKVMFEKREEFSIPQFLPMKEVN